MEEQEENKNRNWVNVPLFGNVSLPDTMGGRTRLVTPCGRAFDRDHERNWIEMKGTRQFIKNGCGTALCLNNAYATLIANTLTIGGEPYPASTFAGVTDELPPASAFAGVSAGALDTGYGMLAGVLNRAFEQAAYGKGKERHVVGNEPFSEQIILKGARLFGVGGLLFQAFKKMEEAQRLPTEAAAKELLGAIVYLAGAVIAIEERGE